MGSFRRISQSRSRCPVPWARFAEFRASAAAAPVHGVECPKTAKDGTVPSVIWHLVHGFVSPEFAKSLPPLRSICAQEAVKCYIAQAHMACCAMCGAAAESILLSAAIAKSGDEEAVLKEYQTAAGRGRVEKRLLGNVKADTRRRFETLTDLLNYWRDTSSHGRTVARSDLESFDALSRLLRFSLFVDERWDELTDT